MIAFSLALPKCRTGVSAIKKAVTADKAILTKNKL